MLWFGFKLIFFVYVVIMALFFVDVHIVFTRLLLEAPLKNLWVVLVEWFEVGGLDGI